MSNATDNSAVKPGDVLAGKYRVEKILGAGGMGYVVAARHLQLDQLVAMKFLRKGAVDNAEAGTRFLREAKAVVKLRNEHVAKVFDVGTLESGEPYIVMEHLEGCDLAQMAKQRHVLPASEACEYILQSCEALAEAHAMGIVHRDIKLANLFVTRGPAGGPLVKVLDFGISKTNPFGESEHDMTRTSSMLGSPRFMSPEQMRDPRAVDGRTDIWSLGVVLYRLVAGRPPFEADTLGRLLTMVMHEQEIPLAMVRDDLPPGFSEVVAHCLQKDPAVRFGTVAELAYALVPFCVDPARARSSADRIAAVLSLPFAPPSGSDVSHPMGMPPGSNRTGPPRPPRASIPAGASDTGGTASPWASGSHNIVRPRTNTTTILAGIALAMLLVGSLVIAKVRREDQAQARVDAAAAAAVAATAPPAPVQIVQPAALGAPSPTAATPEPLPVAPTVVAVATTPAPPSTGMPKAEAAPPPAPAARRASTTTAPRPPTRPATRPAATGPTRTEDGIPTTRD